MRCAMHTIPDIKLIRTDTTLDLSQKAEKRCFEDLNGGQVHFSYLLHVQFYRCEQICSQFREKCVFVKYIRLDPFYIRS